MSRSLSKSSRSAVACAAVLVAGLALALSSASKTLAADEASVVSIIPFSENANCTEISAWVAGNAARLPTTLDGLSLYPMRYRRAIVTNLPVAERIALWEEHFLAVARTENLTTKERAFLGKVVSELPRYFSLPENAREPLAQLTSDAKALFGIERARAIFTNMGPLDNPSSVAGSFAAIISGGAVSTTDCSCSQQSDWCDSGASCEGVTCNSNGGCGVIWVYDCDGLCQRDE